MKAPLRDRMIPWYFVMAFMVVLAVNIVFVRTAIRSNSGVVTEHAYEKGLAYNQVLAEVKAQHALGWQGRIAYENGSLRFRLQDKTATPIAGADVKAYIERPLEEAFSQTITLKETRNGTYEAAVQLPKKGLWDVTVSTTWNKQYYQTRERLIVP